MVKITEKTAGLQVANAAAGVMSAVNDIQDAAIMKDESYASLKILFILMMNLQYHINIMMKH